MSPMSMQATCTYGSPPCPCISEADLFVNSFSDDKKIRVQKEGVKRAGWSLVSCRTGCVYADM
eukprot:1160127-Pelagomonas_calceolata.AAC.3